MLKLCFAILIITFGTAALADDAVRVDSMPVSPSAKPICERCLSEGARKILEDEARKTHDGDLFEKKMRQAEKEQAALPENERMDIFNIKLPLKPSTHTKTKRPSLTEVQQKP